LRAVYYSSTGRSLKGYSFDKLGIREANVDSVWRFLGDAASWDDAHHEKLAGSIRTIAGCLVWKTDAANLSPRPDAILHTNSVAQPGMEWSTVANGQTLLHGM